MSLDGGQPRAVTPEGFSLGRPHSLSPDGKRIAAVTGDGLGPNGKLMVIGAAFEPIEVSPSQLIFGSKTIQGWAAEPPAASEDTLKFSELKGVRP